MLANDGGEIAADERARYTDPAHGEAYATDAGAVVYEAGCRLLGTDTFRYSVRNSTGETQDGGRHR